MLLSLAASATCLMADDEAGRVEHFESKIRPVLIEHCQDCHAVDSEASGGLLLDSESGWQNGGDSGSPIVPGNPSESLLFRVMTYDDPDLQMPPDGKLSDSILDDFEKWIADGAVDPRESDPSSTPPDKSSTALPVERAQEHWSYRPIADAEQHEETTRHTDIDHFVDQRLAAEGLQPTAQASAATLARRLYFDLIGLPPSPRVRDGPCRGGISAPRAAECRA
ncbi:MAG: c-type cytochrome domain-containing protein, partial [Planctomycetota bacterium]